MEQTKGKLVLAVLQGDDYENCVRALNKAGFFATLLSSTGEIGRAPSELQSPHTISCRLLLAPDCFS